MINKKRIAHILYQLGRPLSYYCIKHADRFLYILWLPLILSTLTISLSYFSTIDTFINENGIISKVNSIISGLPGFFIAALAAVATFNKPEIDEEITPRLYIKIKISGAYEKIPLSRRRFLCVLFSNLTMVSLLLSVTTSILINMNLTIEVYTLLKVAGALIYFFIVWQMITSTLIGLFYLGEKIHTPS